MATVLFVEWLQGDAAGYSDHFLPSDFTHGGPTLSHVVWHRKQRPSLAHCSIARKGKKVVLDYGGAFREVNKRAGNWPGQMTLIFSDVSRSSIEGVAWNRKTLEVGVDVKVGRRRVRDIDTADALISERQVETTKRLARPHQRRFRERLRVAYGGRCCMSGCSVSDALVAAHIAPFSKTFASGVKDGLWLRADLHLLWDAGLIAVDARNRIHVAKSIRSDPSYAQLHGRPLGKTVDGTEPDRRALRQHWSLMGRGRAQQSSA